MRAAIYARVSTADQYNAIQIRELTEYLERRGWELSGTYQDTMSGAKANRPGLDHLMADGRQRRFDAVLVWKLDRFGRSRCIASAASRSLPVSAFASLPPRKGWIRMNPTPPVSCYCISSLPWRSLRGID